MPSPLKPAWQLRLKAKGLLLQEALMAQLPDPPAHSSMLLHWSTLPPRPGLHAQLLHCRGRYLRHCRRWRQRQPCAHNHLYQDTNLR